jgi:hypothetical protein
LELQTLAGREYGQVLGAGLIGQQFLLLGQLTRHINIKI